MLTPKAWPPQAVSKANFSDFSSASERGQAKTNSGDGSVLFGLFNEKWLIGWSRQFEGIWLLCQFRLMFIYISSDNSLFDFKQKYFLCDFSFDVLNWRSSLCSASRTALFPILQDNTLSNSHLTVNALRPITQAKNIWWIIRLNISVRAGRHYQGFGTRVSLPARGKVWGLEQSEPARGVQGAWHWLVSDP